MPSNAGGKETTAKAYVHTTRRDVPVEPGPFCSGGDVKVLRGACAYWDPEVLITTGFARAECAVRSTIALMNNI